METETTGARPLIRIEIQNDIANPEQSNMMDVDEEVEDGEVSDNGEAAAIIPMHIIQDESLQRIEGFKWKNRDGGFTTGVDIFSKDEQEKLSVRAQRFGILSNESKAITEQQAQDLYASLGLVPIDEKLVRLDALHIRGVEEMSTKDVFGYFSYYGPSTIEWINDYSCNVVWMDNVSTARALHGLSRKIDGLSEYLNEENPFLAAEKIIEDANKGRSILLMTNSDEENHNPIEWDSDKPINLTNISIPIPPGYWRYGKPHPKAKGILIRYAFKTDKKPLRAEKLSVYYKKYGNPNYGGLKGLISQSKKRQLRGGPLRDQVDSKNPWGSLAQAWNNEDRGITNNESREILQERTVALKTNTSPVIGKSIQDRIGHKRTLVSDEDGSSDNESQRKKVPRMRMYADEEQERINRLKALKTLSHDIQKRVVTKNETDLRSRLGGQVRSPSGIQKRFENRLGTKVVEPELKRPSVHDRISKRVWSDEEGSEEVGEEEEEEEDSPTVDNRQKSTVKIVVKNTPKPSLASTVSRQNSSRSWRLSDREQFRSHYDNRKPREDLRSKITSEKSRKHTTNATLFRKIKREKSSSSSSSESSSDSSDSELSESSSSSGKGAPPKGTSILKKTAADSKFNVKDSLRIEVKNSLWVDVKNDKD